MSDQSSPRVWRRDSKVAHKITRRYSSYAGVAGIVPEDMCEYCGLSAQTIAAERLGCIASLQPKKPQPPKPKRRDGRFWRRH